MEFRRLTADDAPLLVEATGKETGRALWDSQPAGPYTLADAEAALSRWTDEDQSFGVFENNRLVAATGLMPDGDGSAELAYWVRPECRGRGVAVAALRHLTDWAHDNGHTRTWLEIRPDNKASQRVAERAGYTYERRIPNHCESHDCLIWTHYP
ncbi:GNAT family N-acetyltransferase [Actinophytocola glycyrrhizae]|uniref:GNAT family N-acetyltransferase n=1 Tax=Actinophytocola glycyrrhizae TaxID=2044873 RepID=A0ABV9RXZ8_9PSEU